MGFIMKSVTSPTVTNGSFNLYFGDFAQVTDAIVTFDQSGNTDSSGQIDISYNYVTEYGSANYVTVYAKYNDAKLSSGSKIVATTAMLNGKKFVILASGQ